MADWSLVFGVDYQQMDPMFFIQPLTCHFSVVIQKQKPWLKPRLRPLQSLLQNHNQHQHQSRPRLRLQQKHPLWTRPLPHLQTLLQLRVSYPASVINIHAVHRLIFFNLSFSGKFQTSQSVSDITFV